MQLRKNPNGLTHILYVNTNTLTLIMHPNASAAGTLTGGCVKRESIPPALLNYTTCYVRTRVHYDILSSESVVRLTPTNRPPRAGSRATGSATETAVRPVADGPLPPVAPRRVAPCARAARSRQRRRLLRRRWHRRSHPRRCGPARAVQLLLLWPLPRVHLAFAPELQKVAAGHHWVRLHDASSPPEAAISGIRHNGPVRGRDAQQNEFS